MQQRSRSRSSSTGSERNNDALIEPNRRLFICGVSPDVVDAELRSLFEDYGNVTDFYLKRLENGGMLCFVEMKTQDQADNAKQNLNGKRMCGKMMWIKYAKPKAQKEGRTETFGKSKRPNGFQRDQQKERSGGYNRHEEKSSRNNERGNGAYRGRNNDCEDGEKGSGRPNKFQTFEKAEQSYGGKGNGRQRSEATFNEEQVSCKPTVNHDLDY